MRYDLLLHPFYFFVIRTIWNHCCTVIPPVEVGQCTASTCKFLHIGQGGHFLQTQRLTIVSNIRFLPPFCHLEELKFCRCSRASKLPFFSLLLASFGIMDAAGTESAFPGVAFLGLIGGLWKVTAGAVFGRNLSSMPFSFDGFPFSIMNVGPTSTSAPSTSTRRTSASRPRTRTPSPSPPSTPPSSGSRRRTRSGPSSRHSTTEASSGGGPQSFATPAAASSVTSTTMGFQ
ncbi:uncharacterized protein LOC130140588 isoform X1 [Syzygium oleosum]|uniref:uncharacterized protein LOC130140588 isoform X1 n=1 Tax=Syzygium oleosum TaxID=219896 RepID=UPI0024B8B6D3|nr:uncharacterized protein LOC130140588 isoform X1 [Syzygium oleosum]